MPSPAGPLYPAPANRTRAGASASSYGPANGFHSPGQVTLALGPATPSRLEWLQHVAFFGRRTHPRGTASPPLRCGLSHRALLVLVIRRGRAIVVVRLHDSNNNNKETNDSGNGTGLLPSFPTSSVNKGLSVPRSNSTVPAQGRKLSTTRLCFLGIVSKLRRKRCGHRVWRDDPAFIADSSIKLNQKSRGKKQCNGSLIEARDPADHPLQHH
jgi:hypothetical protein